MNEQIINGEKYRIHYLYHTQRQHDCRIPSFRLCIPFLDDIATVEMTVEVRVEHANIRALLHRVMLDSSVVEAIDNRVQLAEVLHHSSYPNMVYGHM